MLIYLYTNKVVCNVFTACCLLKYTLFHYTTILFKLDYWCYFNFFFSVLIAFLVFFLTIKDNLDLFAFFFNFKILPLWDLDNFSEQEHDIIHAVLFVYISPPSFFLISLLQFVCFFSFLSANEHSVYSFHLSFCVFLFSFLVSFLFFLGLFLTLFCTSL